MSWKTMFVSAERQGASSSLLSSSLTAASSCFASSMAWIPTRAACTTAAAAHSNITTKPAFQHTQHCSASSFSATSSSSSSCLYVPSSSSRCCSCSSCACRGIFLARNFSTTSSSSSTVKSDDEQLSRARELLKGSKPLDRQDIPRRMNIHSAFSESVSAGDLGELKQMENVAREQFEEDAFRRIGRKNLMRAYTEKLKERSIEERRDVPFSGDDFHLTEAERRIRFPDLVPPESQNPNDKRLNIEQLYRLHFRYYLRLRHRLFPSMRRRDPYKKWDRESRKFIRFAKRDELGRSHGKGSRKKARANVWIWPAEDPNGGGLTLVNGKNFAEYFHRWSYRAEVTKPFLLSETMGQFNVFAVVKGGGPTGQAGAVKLGLARALCNYDPALRGILKRARLLTVDHRNKEAKKPGRTKARRGWQWVKR